MNFFRYFKSTPSGTPHNQLWCKKHAVHAPLQQKPWTLSVLHIKLCTIASTAHQHVQKYNTMTVPLTTRNTTVTTIIQNENTQSQLIINPQCIILMAVLCQECCYNFFATIFSTSCIIIMLFLMILFSNNFLICSSF